MKSRDPSITLRQQDVFFRQFVSLPFDDQAVRHFGEIRSDFTRKGTPIGPYDLQIAAIALTNSCILVTHNIAEFSPVGGLKLEDWEVAV